MIKCLIAIPSTLTVPPEGLARSILNADRETTARWAWGPTAYAFDPNEGLVDRPTLTYERRYKSRIRPRPDPVWPLFPFPVANPAQILAKIADIHWFLKTGSNEQGMNCEAPGGRGGCIFGGKLLDDKKRSSDLKRDDDDVGPDS